MPKVDRHRRGSVSFTVGRPVAGLRRGAALLEVVLAISILLIAVGVVGLAFSNGEYHLDRAELIARATLMTERVIGQFDVGALALSPGETTGVFGEEAPPGISYRVTIKSSPTMPDLMAADVEVYLGDPTDEQDRKLILGTRVLRATPKLPNLPEMLGIPPEELEKKLEQIPGAALAGIDPAAFDPCAIAATDLDTLAEFLPILLTTLGASGGLPGLPGQMGGLPAGGEPAAAPPPGKIGEPVIQPPTGEKPGKRPRDERRDGRKEQP